MFLKGKIKNKITSHLQTLYAWNLIWKNRDKVRRHRDTGTASVTKKIKKPKENDGA